MMETASVHSASPVLAPEGRRGSRQERSGGFAAGLAALLFILSAPGAHAQDDGVSFKPIKIFSYLDMGQVVKGANPSRPNEDGSIPQLRGYFLSNIGIAILTEADVREKLHLKVGVGGLFWYPFPNIVEDPSSRTISFGPGIAEASFKYDFLENLTLKVGFIGYKYNSDAQNLGEYLFRSEAYPHFVKTGGWSWINSSYQSLGMHLNWSTFGGAWTHDFLVFSEFEESPAFDMSPAYVSTLKVGKTLELGGGVSLHRWLPVKPSDETPSGGEEGANTYVEIPNFPVLPFLTDTVWIDPAKPHDASNVKAVKWSQLAHNGGRLKAMENHLKILKDANGNTLTKGRDARGTYYVMGPDTLRADVRERLTFQGIKLMGRASLDFKPMLGLEDALGAGDLKVFGEVAVLGVQNQGYYYQDITQRMPMMAGVNLPTFKLLDLLSVQFEYYKNPWPDSKQTAFQQTYPQWSLKYDFENNPAAFEQARQAGTFSEDDWKWSVNAMRTLTPGLTLNVQAANDHFRLRDQFFQPSYVPLTHKKDHWYYVVRLQWGI
jgi:hypothetical protein